MEEYSKKELYNYLDNLLADYEECITYDDFDNEYKDNLKIEIKRVKELIRNL